MEQIEMIETCLEQMRLWDTEGTQPAENTAEYILWVQNTVAPAAEELGLSKHQHELEELSVKLGFPEDYRHLKKLLLESEMTCEMVFRTFALPIRSMLDDLGIEYEFKYRMKSVYSIWRKMKTKGTLFDEVYDLFASRIVYKPTDGILPLPGAQENVVDKSEEACAVRDWQLANIDVERACCWRIYTVISMLYRIHPERIRNWITHPKPSGYQALQLTVMGPDCNWIEIQVRSERMDYEAEKGSAAHWMYKKEKPTA